MHGTRRRALLSALLAASVVLLCACDVVSVADSTQPTASPRSDQSRAPAESEPAFKPIRLHGRGGAVPRFRIPKTAIAIAEITHKGEANFVIWTLDADGDQQDLLVNVIGNYHGTVLFDEQTGQHSVAFKVEADGEWTIRIMPLSKATKWSGDDALSRRGDNVISLNPPPEGLVSTRIRHDGSANFVVWAYGESSELLVNDIGRYRGESVIPAGTVVLEIAADGQCQFSALR